MCLGRGLSDARFRNRLSEGVVRRGLSDVCSINAPRAAGLIHAPHRIATGKETLAAIAQLRDDDGPDLRVQTSRGTFDRHRWFNQQPAAARVGEATSEAVEARGWRFPKTISLIEVAIVDGVVIGVKGSERIVSGGFRILRRIRSIASEIERVSSADVIDREPVRAKAKPRCLFERSQVRLLLLICSLVQAGAFSADHPSERDRIA